MEYPFVWEDGAVRPVIRCFGRSDFVPYRRQGHADRSRGVCVSDFKLSVSDDLCCSDVLLGSVAVCVVRFYFGLEQIRFPYPLFVILHIGAVFLRPVAAVFRRMQAEVWSCVRLNFRGIFQICGIWGFLTLRFRKITLRFMPRKSPVLPS